MSASSREDRLPIGYPPLADRKVLVVACDIWVSMVIEEILADQQSVVIGPFSRLPPALQVAHAAEIDIALLDVPFGSAEVYRIAEALSLRLIPFLLLSGFGAEAVPAGRPEWRFCSKPFSGRVLLRKMLEEIERHSQD